MGDPVGVVAFGEEDCRIVLGSVVAGIAVHTAADVGSDHSPAVAGRAVGFVRRCQGVGVDRIGVSSWIVLEDGCINTDLVKTSGLLLV